MRTTHAKRAFAATLAALLLPVLGATQGEPEVVGRIEGDDIAVKGQISLLREAGHKSTALVSGSEVTVRSGGARLVFTDGSEIDICGPAQFSVLKSGPAITVALNYGRAHARLSPEIPVTLYTPLVVATPLSISGRPRDMVVGVEAAGGVCTRPTHGAVRLEQQLTGASLIVPQGGEALAPEGQMEALRDAPGACRCDAVLADDLEKQRAQTQTVSMAVLPKPEERRREEVLPPEARKPAQQVPEWQVVMPPLMFEAAAPAPPPEPSPEMAVLFREARVQQAVVFSGRVEPRGKAPSATPREKKVEGAEKTGFGARVKNFFLRLFGKRPQAGFVPRAVGAGLCARPGI